MDLDKAVGIIKECCELHGKRGYIAPVKPTKVSMAEEMMGYSAPDPRYFNWFLSREGVNGFADERMMYIHPVIPYLYSELVIKYWEELE